MKNLHILATISVLASALFFAGCDKIEKPYLKTTNSVSSDSLVFADTLPQAKGVLLEDYTGHTCGNCPGAADIAAGLKTTYGEQVVIVAVHAGGFAKPKGTLLSYDFRTPAGDEWDTFFGISAVSNPNGMIDRDGYPTTHVKSKSAWAGAVANESALAVQANLFFATKYDASTRVLTIGTMTKTLAALTSTYKLVVVITEDSIVQPQLDYRFTPDTITNYIHHHALRGAASPAMGDEITLAPIGGSVIKAYNVTLGNDWVAEHCSVAAFLYDATTYKVVQAAEQEIVP